MKLKQQPEDFQVVEQTRYRLDPKGRHALYRLSKRGLSTLEAVDIVARMWRLRKPAVGFGGLKDKHAATEQVISVERGPARGLDQPRLKLAFLGRSCDPIRRESFAGNAFVLVLRDLGRDDVARLRARLRVAVRAGIPNYFDTQRFGSVRGSHEFAVKRLLLGDNEGALRLALAVPTQEDPRRQREIREVLHRHWGDWKACHAALPVCSERSIVTYLEAHPAEFRRAFELLDRNLRNLYCSAYQSLLWNRILGRLVRTRAGAAAVELPYGPGRAWGRAHGQGGRPLKAAPPVRAAGGREPEGKGRDASRPGDPLGVFVFWEDLAPAAVEELRALSIPAPRHNLALASPELARLFEQAFLEEGVLQKDFRLRGMQDTYFKRGNRAALVFPEGLGASDDEPDELNAGRRKLTLSFGLPRGSYATILVKALALSPAPAAVAGAEAEDDKDEDAGGDEEA